MKPNPLKNGENPDVGDKFKMRETLKRKLREIIESLETQSIPARVVAWHFDLSEPYSAELAGSSSYDDEDEDWACEDEDEFYPQNACADLDFLRNLSWEEVLDAFVRALRELREQMPEAKFFSYEHIAAGFVDGDLVLI